MSEEAREDEEWLYGESGAAEALVPSVPVVGAVTGSGSVTADEAAADDAALLAGTEEEEGETEGVLGPAEEDELLQENLVTDAVSGRKRALEEDDEPEADAEAGVNDEGQGPGSNDVCQYLVDYRIF